MKGVRYLLLLAAVSIVALLVTELNAQQDSTTTQPQSPVQVTSRTATINGIQVGEVLVGDTVVFRIREAAGGYTPAQRAAIVAGRMDTLLDEGYAWSDVEVGQLNDEVVLLMGNNLLITVDEAHASINGTTPILLAYEWQGRTQTALRTEEAVAVAGAEETTAVAGTEETTTAPPVATNATTGTNSTTGAVAATQQTWPSWDNAATRIVPIISAGTPGVRLGAAQITGPRDRVDDVDAVLQLDVVFQRSARIGIFVPSSSISELDRVQGVAVTALLQYRALVF